MEINSAHYLPSTLIVNIKVGDPDSVATALANRLKFVSNDASPKSPASLTIATETVTYELDELLTLKELSLQVSRRDAQIRFAEYYLLSSIKYI